MSFDGEGTLITTEQMLMNSNRNSNFTRKEIENEFVKKYNKIFNIEYFNE